VLHEESLTIEAANALAQIGDPQALDGLLSLIGHTDVSIRQAAVNALNSLAAPSMSMRIIPLLNDPDPNVRESAVKVVGYFGYRESADGLLELCSDSVERVRCAAVEHLPYIEDDRALNTLVKAINEETPKVRAAAARALGNLDAPQVVQHLTNGLADEDVWVRYFSARALGRRRSNDSIEALARVILHEKFNHVRIAALDSLGQIGGQRIAGIVASLVEDNDADLAHAALVALGKIDHPTAVPPLLKALRSPRAQVRAGAAEALGARGQGDAWEDLLRVAATDADKKVIDASILALKQIGTDDTCAALMSLLDDANRRDAAMAALADSSDDHIEVIAKGLSHSSAHVRRSIVEVLARMKRPRASQWLHQALDDSDLLIRHAALDALGQSRG
jgi:HEAT repeat protein